MTKQEEIREGLITKIKSIRAWGGNPDDPLSPEDDVEDILRYLHSQGVVIKVDKELPENPFDKSTGLSETAHNGFAVAGLRYKRAGFAAVEPLVEK